MPLEVLPAHRDDLRRRLALNIVDLVYSRYGHHMQRNESEALALAIERSAFEVALRDPEGKRGGTYAKAASRLLLNAVLKLESNGMAAEKLGTPNILDQDESSWASQGLVGTDSASAQQAPQGSTISEEPDWESEQELSRPAPGGIRPSVDHTDHTRQQGTLRPIFSAPMPPTPNRGRCINRQMSLSLRKQEVRDIFTGLAASGKGSRGPVWGWLEPGSATLPYVLLHGDEMALGRSLADVAGNQAMPTVAPILPDSPENSLPPTGAAASVAPAGALSMRLLNFVSVKDGRVSRLHCVFRPAPIAADAPVQVDEASSSEQNSLRNGQQAYERSSLYGAPPTQVPPVLLLDCSTNGTFINGARASSQGLGTPLQNGDRVSLVLSVTPLVEQYFIFHAGEPADRDKREWATVRRIACLAAEEKQMLASPAATRLRMRSLQRMSTSKYTTADTSTLEDFQCQICLGTLRSCVALEPCGHNFCAPCLSHHFASQLMTSNTLTCPLRCVAPSKIVANAAVRKLVHRFKVPANVRSKQPHLPQPCAQSATFIQSSPRLPAGELTDEEDEDMQMSQLCPLNDEILPISASGLRLKQVDALLSQVEKSERDSDVLISSLETLAKIAWNDDEVRKEIADMEGVTTIVNTMKRWTESGGVQCNGCLAIVSLVRSESEICQSNQWRVARGGGLEAIVAAMRRFREFAMVQLCALLCMVPLALENTILQAHLAGLGLPDIFIALTQHLDQVDLQAKGLVALGVLGQGEEPMHDAIRARQLQLGAAGVIAHALERHGRTNEEVLWAALFALAVLVREGSALHSLALRSTAAAGMLPLLQSCMAAYKAKAAARQEEGDEMIISAGDFLIRALKPAAARLQWERVALVTLAGAALGIVAWKCRGLVLER